MDEALEYVVKAAGVKVGDTNLAAQTLAFIQELTGAVSTVGNALLVLTLPSSTLEHYNEHAERAFQTLQKITGRVEKIYTPVKEEEIEEVIKKRLFREINEEEAKKVVDDLVEYLQKENLLSKEEAIEYRNKFLKSYPFKPEVIDILYKRWGSFPSFQRTRGVLRLLSLVIHDLLDKRVSFIRLGDFDLKNEELRRELIKHIGQEWDSIIAQDITDESSGAKKVDEMLGSSYSPYKLGTLVSTTIFMTSHSGRGEKGSTLKEIKLSVVEPAFSSSVIDTVISHLRERLFYLSDEGLFFTNQPNLNRLILSREENVSPNEIYEKEEKILKEHISRESKFKIYIHPKFPKDIPDNEDLKLIIFNTKEPDKEFLEKYGENPRIYKNTLIFLCIDEENKGSFYAYIKKLIALEKLNQEKKDKRMNLSENQKKELEEKLKKHKDREYEELRKFYRKLFVPAKNGFKEMDMGTPTYGESKIDKEIYEYLKNRGEILERLAPKLIKDRYLAERDFIEIKKLYEALLKTPGELRIISREGFVDGVSEGVKNGLFGFGYIENDKPICETIKTLPKITFSDEEVIIKPDLCKKEIDKKEDEWKEESEIKRNQEQETDKKITGNLKIEESNIKEKINIRLDVPSGKMSTVTRIVNYLSEKFKRCEVEVIIKATDGKINRSEYEDKIIEALNQEGIKFEEGDE